MKTITPYIYPYKLHESHYLDLIELLWIVRLPQLRVQLNLIHDVNYIFHAFLPSSCLYLLLGFVYTLCNNMVHLTFTALYPFSMQIASQLIKT